MEGTEMPATYIYNCKHCKTGKRVEYPHGSPSLGFSRIDSNGKSVPAGVWIMVRGGGRPTIYGGDVEKGICPNCKRAMEYHQLRATLRPEVKCNSICIHA